MLEPSSVLQYNTPDSLKDLVIEHCLNNVDVLEMQLNSNSELHIPQEIGNRILYVCSNKKQSKDELLCVLALFKDPIRTPLSIADLHDTKLDDMGMEYLSKHKLMHLDISKCDLLTPSSYKSLLKLGQSMLYLKLGEAPKFLYFRDQERITKEIAFQFPQLRSLVIWDFAAPFVANCSSPEFECFVSGFKQMKFLTYLDLSKGENLECIRYIPQDSCLHSLIPYDVAQTQSYIPNICLLKELRHLDISQPIKRPIFYLFPTATLTLIVSSLEKLESLDISGTNLAELFPERSNENGQNGFTDIAGLESRVNRPLEFLGLYNATNNPCDREHIPAKKITGDNNIDQVLLSCQAYCNRPEICSKALTVLYHILQSSTCYDVKMVLTVVIECMKRKNKLVTINARTIIKIVLDAMSRFINYPAMIRNGLEILGEFQIFEDLFFVFTSLITCLLSIASLEGIDQTSNMYLMHRLSSCGDIEQKKIFGDLGAVPIMLKIIARRLSDKVCDDIMDYAWHILVMVNNLWMRTECLCSWVASRNFQISLRCCTVCQYYCITLQKRKS